MEERYRQELDKLRSEQATAIGELEANHIISKKQHDTDKQKLEDEKVRSLEQERKKLLQLNKIDLDARDLQYKKSLDGQRALFEEQMSALSK